MPLRARAAQTCRWRLCCAVLRGPARPGAEVEQEQLQARGVGCYASKLTAARCFFPPPSSSPRTPRAQLFAPHPVPQPDRIALCSAFETLLNRPYLPQGIPTELQAATAQLDSDVIDKKYKEIALQKRGRTSTRELMLKGSKKVGSAINMALGNMNMGRKKSAPNPTDIKAPMLPPRVPPSNKARKSVLKKTHRMGGSAPNLLDGNSQKRPKRMPSQPPSHAANAKCISSSTAQFRSKGASANEAGKKSSKNHRRTRSSAGRSLSNAEALKAAMHEGQPSRGKAPKHHGNRMVRSKSGSRIGSADSGNVHMKLASSNQKTVFSKYADVEQQCREAKSKTKVKLPLPRH